MIQIGFTYLPFMQQWFGTAPLRLVDWFYLLAGGFAVLAAVEIEKLLTGLIFRKNKKM